MSVWRVERERERSELIYIYGSHGPGVVCEKERERCSVCLYWEGTHTHGDTETDRALYPHFVTRRGTVGF